MIEPPELPFAKRSQTVFDYQYCQFIQRISKLLSTLHESHDSYDDVFQEKNIRKTNIRKTNESTFLGKSPGRVVLFLIIFRIFTEFFEDSS